ncbi:ABC transporter ATP-binding protein [Pelosinus sp. IPA-1]|uniref:ABC transporter ATP-binding protein n=1 Tax=Pelosinus sp. IPA-1 TaxID=3029569 RepID=UPI002552D641|nr:ABC transporter ATP-binding protein [Pelosinus sp. IPA-1]
MMRKYVNVELTDVGKHYSGKMLFHSIGATAKPGECLVITGRNGSGKSTLMKIIAGLIRPSYGTVRLVANGQQLTANDRFDCIGMVSPEVALYGAMSGYENLKFLAQVRGMNLAKEELSRYLAAVGLEEEQHSQVGAYSTGMRQRLKFAVMLALHSPLWLLDEPSSNLDTEGKELVGKMIRGALGEGTTIIIATNEWWEAEYATQKINLG